MCIVARWRAWRAGPVTLVNVRTGPAAGSSFQAQRPSAGQELIHGRDLGVVAAETEFWQSPRVLHGAQQ